jgi:diguanylate cyclase (GGDEF)-like protein/PAS domain S-box-containing protein/excisionase family DNA binding protein
MSAENQVALARRRRQISALTMSEEWDSSGRRPEEPDRAALLEAALESSDEGLLAVDSRGRVIACNRAFADICRVPSDLVARADEAVLLEHLAARAEDPLACREGVMRAYAQPHGHTQDIVRLRDGGVVERRSCALDVGESTCGRVWMFRDVTEDEIAQARVSDAARLFVEAQAVAHVGTWELDVAEDLWTWSDEMYRIYGLDRSVFRPTVAGIVERCVPEDRERARASIEAAVRAGTLIDTQAQITRPDGQVRVVHVRARALRDEHNAVVKVLGTLQDVTERQMAQGALRAAEERFRMAFDQAPTGAALIGLDGRIQRVNQALAEETGFSPDELVGRRLRDVVERQSDDDELMRELLDGAPRIVAERQYRNARGQQRWASITATVLHDDAGSPREVIARVVDVTERRRKDARRAHEAQHDTLTGLPNASAFYAQFESARAEYREGGEPPCVIYLDLDRFKAVNDALGRTIGDRILVVIAHRLRAAARPDALVARIGGDEFAVLQPRGPANAALIAFATDLRETLSAPVMIGDGSVTQDASVGVAVARQPADTADELLREAENAATIAKQHGGGRVEVFDDVARQRLVDDMRLERDLRRALEDEAFELVFQPIVELRTGALVGLETLLRWEHPELGDIPPDRIIPLAERTMMMAPLGDWIFRTVCRFIAHWNSSGLRVPQVSVNVSPRQLDQPGFPTRLRRMLREASIPVDAVSLEITESALVELPVAAEKVLEELQALGFKAILDDFGVGYSSLSYLRRYPVEGLKIDGSFVRDLPGDPHAAAIVEAIAAMGRAVGLRMIAEGVETQEQAGFVRTLGCPFAQGYLFSRPLRAEAVPAVLQHGLPHAVAPGEGDDGATMTLGEAAAALSVSPTTIRRLVKSGRLPEIRTAGGHRRFRRIDVNREAARMRPEPVLRSPRLPERPMPRVAAIMRERTAWLRDVSLRALYVGDDHGWFGSPIGRAELERWLKRLADAIAAGDFGRAQDVTHALVRTARRAAVPLVECVALVDAVGQAVRAALTEGGAGSDELPELGRIFNFLRRVAVE